MATDPLAALARRPAVATSVTDARAAVDGLLGHRVLRRRSAEVTAESSLRGARASADLDGAALPLATLRDQLTAGDRVHGLAEPGRTLVENAVRLYAGLGPLVGVWQRAPRQALARLHVLAAVGLVPDSELGRPRSRSLPDAPVPGELTARLDRLVEVLTTPTEAPALVVAAVVHGELLTLQPFTVGNGLVARAAARLVFITRGLDPKAVTAPEVGHVELRREYAEALTAYAAGGVQDWIAHCGQAVALGAREGLAVCEAIQRGAASRA